MTLKSAPRSTSTAAFTLIELIISAAVSSLILIAAYLCLNSGYQTQAMIEERIDVSQTARVAIEIITADLRAAVPLSSQFDFIGMDRTLEGAEADNLDFATQNHTPTAPGEGAFAEVSYFLAPATDSPALSLWRRKDTTPDDDPLAGGVIEEVATGVHGLTFQYYDGFEWYDDWGSVNPEDPMAAANATQMNATNSLLAPGNLSGMPAAVSVSLSFKREPPKKTTRESSNNNDERAEPPPLTYFALARMNLNDRDLYIETTAYGLEEESEADANTENGSSF